ncbi:unnamed protein product [Dovyalis caffra]|uniref:Uncharacterized protein n=1 Tax=Dovyalis caffra TaxID=77055 RepID=A0AAV1SUP6_9ROSI|nr:unnamed protein product [Dovyalis caffra]
MDLQFLSRRKVVYLTISDTINTNPICASWIQSVSVHIHLVCVAGINKLFYDLTILTDPFNANLFTAYLTGQDKQTKDNLSSFSCDSFVPISSAASSIERKEREEREEGEKKGENHTALKTNDSDDGEEEK